MVFIQKLMYLVYFLFRKQPVCFLVTSAKLEKLVITQTFVFLDVNAFLS